MLNDFFSCGLSESILKLPLCCRGGRGSLYSQLFLFKENDVIQVEVCQLLKRPVFNRHVIDPVFLGLVSAAIGRFLHRLIDPLRRTMNLNVEITGDCDIC